ncbi:MAG: hypothetical protein EOO88_44510 [Pedobacter sp.]|nr:MAG: hypothetical protein EOO88_44510 [Pedobacter sp.]
MKIHRLLFLSLFAGILSSSAFSQSFSQNIIGEWKGSYSFDKGDFYVPQGKTQISIIIDSGNIAHSYTYFKTEFKRDTVIEKELKFEMLGKNRYKFSEIGDTLMQIDELQTFLLTWKPEAPSVLSGKWVSGLDWSHGPVRLVRQPRRKAVFKPRS